MLVILPPNSRWYSYMCGAPGEVAFIKRDFAVVVIVPKNKTGTWPKGSDRACDVTFVENDRNCKNPVDHSTHVENSVTDLLLVVDKAETIAIT